MRGASEAGPSFTLERSAAGGGGTSPDRRIIAMGLRSRPRIMKNRLDSPRAYRALDDGLENRLDGRWRPRDGPKNLSGRRLLLYRLHLALQRLRQALLEVADPRVIARQGLVEPGRLRLGLSLRGLYRRPISRSSSAR